MEDFIRNLVTLLNQEINLTGELLLLLEDEVSALTTMDDSKINLYTQRKEELITRLQDIIDQRAAYMKKSSISMEMIHRDAELEQQFSRLDELTTRCIEKNRFIGQLIHRRSSLINDLLGKMTGSLPTADMTYSSSGQAEHMFRSRNHIA